MYAPDPLEPFLEAIPYDRARVLSEARQFARYERKAQLRLFGRGAASLFECAKAGMDQALSREEIRRRNQALPAYHASMHPLERERKALEIEVWRLSDKLLGEGWPDARRFYREKIAAYQARLSEIAALQAELRAA